MTRTEQEIVLVACIGSNAARLTAEKAVKDKAAKAALFEEIEKSHAASERRKLIEQADKLIEQAEDLRDMADGKPPRHRSTGVVEPALTFDECAARRARISEPMRVAARNAVLLAEAESEKFMTVVALFLPAVLLAILYAQDKLSTGHVIGAMIAGSLGLWSAGSERRRRLRREAKEAQRLRDGFLQVQAEKQKLT